MMVDAVQPPPAISWRYVVAWELPPSLSKDHDEILPRHHCWKSLIIQNETTQLQRSEYELKLRGDSLKRLEEGLLHRDEENSTWNKIQIVLFAVLIGGLSVLFQFWPWLPLEYLRPVVVAFGCIWVLDCVALPFLFGAEQGEICFGEHTAQAALMCFSVFVLYGLYRMCVIPMPSSDHSIAPTPGDHPVNTKWGFVKFSFITLVAVALGGQLISWSMNCVAAASQMTRLRTGLCRMIITFC